MIAGAFGMWQMHLAQVESARDLEPALAREITAKGELGRIKERRDADESTLLRTMARLQLDEETLQIIRQMSQWSIQLTPYHALMKLRDARTNSRENLLSDASIILGNVMPDVRRDEVDEALLERAVLKVGDYLQKCRLKEQMGATTGERRREMEAAATQLAEADGRLTAILDELLVPPCWRMVAKRRVDSTNWGRPPTHPANRKYRRRKTDSLSWKPAPPRMPSQQPRRMRWQRKGTTT